MRFNRTYYSLLFCCLSLPFSLLARDAKSVTADGLQGKPMLFMENKGQIVDQNNNARNDVQFRLSTPGLDVLVGEAQLHYQFSKAGTDDNISTYRMDISLEGANRNAQMVKGEQQQYFERYLQSRFGDEGIVSHSYNSITYKNVYPGIDWVLYVKGSQLEYDFVVHEGADASAIKLKYAGATNLKLSADGSITATSPFGTVTEKAPVAYVQENGKKVASGFQLHNNTLSFNVKATKGTLVIDPVLKWATYYGGTGASDNIRSIAIDGAGKIYATGQTSATNQIATGGAFLGSYQGGTWDAFLVKFDANGGRIWGTYFGGTGNDIGYGIAVDGAYKVYISGSTTSTSGISAGTTPAQPTYGGSGGGGTGDAYLEKFDSSGQRIWGTYKGGNGNEQGMSVYVNSSYQVFLAGNSTTGGTNSIATATAYSNTYAGGFQYGDAFLAKYDSAGSPAWCTYYGGTGDDIAYGVVSDAAGNNIYITGSTTSSSTTAVVPHNIATTGSHQSTYGGANDAYLACFNSAGTALTFGTYLGGTGNDISYSIATDASSNLYIAGSTTTSAAGIIGVGGFQNTYSNTFNTDAFLSKFSSTGTLTWSTYYGSDSISAANGVAVDRSNNVYIVGNSRSIANMVTSDAYQSTKGGLADAFIARFTSAGARTYASFLGGTASDVAQAVACSPAGTREAVVMGGYSLSSSGVATSGAYQTLWGGGSTYGDAILARFAEDTIVYIKTPFVDTVLCAGQTFTVHDSVNHNFLAGNTFKVQLSDASGSFASPVDISLAVSATTSGNISATIPAGTSAGNGYRIRIISTNPVDTSASDPVNIRVFKLVAPVAGNNGPVCVGDSVNLTSTNPNSVSVTYSWSGPVSFTSTLQNPTRPNLTTAMSGVYTVTLSYTGCASVSGTTTVTVNSTIPAKPTASANPNPVCQFQTLNLFSNSTVSGITYIWTGPNNFSSTSQNPVITNIPVIAGGNYYAQVNLNGCRSAKDTVIVTVSPSLTPSITISADPANDSVCAGHVISFTASTTNAGNNPTYQWYDNHQPVIGAISDIWGSPLLSSGDSIYCILSISSSGACVAQNVVSSNVIGITILPTVVPVAYIYLNTGTTIAPGTSVTFTSYVINPGAADTYQWSVNGVAVPAPFGTGSVFTTQALMDSDVVTLEVHSTAACAEPDSAASNSILMHVTNNTGVKEVNAFSDVNLYPNPTSGNFSVKGLLNGLNSKAISIEMMNALGQVIYSETTPVNNSVLDQKISVNVADGIYMLRIKSDEQSKSFRVIVQH